MVLDVVFHLSLSTFTPGMRQQAVGNSEVIRNRDS